MAQMHLAVSNGIDRIRTWRMRITMLYVYHDICADIPNTDLTHPLDLLRISILMSVNVLIY